MNTLQLIGRIYKESKRWAVEHEGVKAGYDRSYILTKYEEELVTEQDGNLTTIKFQVRDRFDHNDGDGPPCVCDGDTFELCLFIDRGKGIMWMGVEHGCRYSYLYNLAGDIIEDEPNVFA